MLKSEIATCDGRLEKCLRTCARSLHGRQRHGPAESSGPTTHWRRSCSSEEWWGQSPRAVGRFTYSSSSLRTSRIPVASCSARSAPTPCGLTSCSGYRPIRWRVGRTARRPGRLDLLVGAGTDRDQVLAEPNFGSPSTDLAGCQLTSFEIGDWGGMQSVAGAGRRRRRRRDRRSGRAQATYARRSSVPTGTAVGGPPDRHDLGESPPDEALRSLQTYVSNLRRMLDANGDGMIERTTDGYRLNTGAALTTDVEEYETSSRRPPTAPRPIAPRRCGRRWHLAGQPLGEIGNDDWAQPIVARWTDLRRSTRPLLDLRLGQPGRVVADGAARGRAPLSRAVLETIHHGAVPDGPPGRCARPVRNDPDGARRGGSASTPGGNWSTSRSRS